MANATIGHAKRAFILVCKIVVVRVQMFRWRVVAHPEKGITTQILDVILSLHSIVRLVSKGASEQASKQWLGFRNLNRKHTDWD